MPLFRGVSRRSLIVLLLAALAAPAFAQSTGRLAGHVHTNHHHDEHAHDEHAHDEQAHDGRVHDSDAHDEEEISLPGVSITVSSPALMGTRTEFTDAAGNFSFPSLPPGVYTIDVEMEGFLPQRRSEVEVRLNRVTEIHMDLEPGQFTGEVTVVAQTPMVDPEQVSTSQSFSAEHIEESSIGSINRRYYAVLAQAPGVVQTTSVNPHVFGSTVAENVYYIDSIDSTDPVTSTVGVHVNFDAIQEINLETGGFEARYGRATGGVINVVTKSGGNDLSGTLDVRYRDTDFNTNGEHFDKDEDIFEYSEPSFTLGGPFRRDRLWFFAGVSEIRSKTTPTESPTTRALDNTNLLGKVTWQVNESWQAVGRYLSDRPEVGNANASRFTSPDAASRQEGDTSVLSAEVLGLSGSNLEWHIAASTSRGNLDIVPQSGDFDTIGHYAIGRGFVETVNYSELRFTERDRDELTVSGAWFSGHSGGDHELRLGVDYGDVGYRRQRNLTGGGQFLTWRGQPFSYLVQPHAGPTDTEGNLLTTYLQDTWRPTHELTLKFGVRRDEVSFTNDVGNKVADMAKWQPRLGVAWDVTGNAKMVVRASWGRFMHPSALVLPSYARANITPRLYYFSCSRFSRFFLGVAPERCMQASPGERMVVNHTVPNWTADPQGYDPNGWFFLRSFAGEPNRIAEGLKPTYAEEAIVGVEMEVARRTSIGLTYVDKVTSDIFEDTCSGNWPTPTPTADCDYYVVANLPELTRDYQGFLLDIESRVTDWLHILGSYVRSESRGNVEYYGYVSTNFDVYPDHFENRYGFLSDHRKHRVKMNGHVSLPLDFVLGFDVFWSSPFVYTPWSWGNSYGAAYQEPRGSAEANENHRLDLQMARGFRVGKNNRFELIASIYNVLDDEQSIRVCTRSRGCWRDIEVGDPTRYREPRRFEAGVRFEF